MLIKNVTSFETLQHSNPKIGASTNAERQKQVSMHDGPYSRELVR